MIFEVKRASGGGKPPGAGKVLKERFDFIPQWHVEVSSLEELMELVSAEGRIIVDTPLYEDSGVAGSILVYDDYIE